MNIKKSNKGITLVALVITIVILLILSIITIREVQGEGLIQKSKQAVIKHEIAQEKEKMQLAVADLKMTKANGNVKVTNTMLEDKIKDYGIENETIGDGYFTVKIAKSGRLYTIDEKGAIEGPIEKTEDTNPGHLEGEGTQENPFIIASIEDLVTFSNKVNGIGYEITSNGEAKQVTESHNYEGEYVELACDLDFKSEVSYVNASRTDFGTDGTLMSALTTGTGFSPIGKTKELRFVGTFDGKEKTISNLYINIAGNYAGLFAQASNISNLNLKNGNITGKGCSGGIVALQKDGVVKNCNNINTFVQQTLESSSTSGGIVGQASGNVENCTNSGTIKGTGERIGGIVGKANADIIKCSNTGNVEGKSGVVGGIVGYSATTSNLQECNNEGNVLSESSWAGGIAGYSIGTINKCVNSGNITGKTEKALTRIGGIVGSVGSVANDGNIKNCNNEGIVTGDKIVGGIAGSLENNGNVENCNNKGSVTGNEFIGGIVGSLTNDGNIENCSNSGEIKAKDGSAGGIVGTASGVVTKCYNTGNVLGTENIGGIVGSCFAKRTQNISLCYNSGNIKGTGNEIGGISGYLGAENCNATETLCYNKGKVESQGEKKGGIVGNMASDANVTKSFYLSNIGITQGVGSINAPGDLSKQNEGAQQTDTDLNSFEEFIKWIEQYK